MRLETVNNYVSFKLRPSPNRRIGFIELSDSNTKQPRWGDVISVGPGVVDFNGELVKPDIEPGQLVYVASHGQHEVKAFAVGLEDITIASVLDVLAVMKNIETREIQPLGSLIEVEKIEQEEEMMGQLYMPEIKRFPPNAGRVKTLGLGWKTIMSQKVPFQVEVGDIVIWNPFSEQTIDLSGLGIDEKKYLIQHGEIQAVLRSNEVPESNQ